MARSSANSCSATPNEPHAAICAEQEAPTLNLVAAESGAVALAECRDAEEMAERIEGHEGRGRK